MNFNLKEIFEQFDVPAKFVGASQFGSGHINDTFLVESRGKRGIRYLLQRINHFVFKNPPALMNNFRLIEAHLRRKLHAGRAVEFDLDCFKFFPAKVSGELWVKNQENFWRLGVFIENSHSLDLVDSVEKARKGGLAFGHFLALFSDFPVGELHYSIPDFHNMAKRLQDFKIVLEEDKFGRKKETEPEIAEFLQREEEMKMVHHLAASEKIPLRVTHNDTKFNNILFDEEENIIGVIDLDTVMPGLVHSDFGDAIRTCTNTAAEDEIDLHKVSMDMDLFAAYASGYLEKAKFILNEIEKDTLAFGAIMITYMQALRFFTDYLSGDVYYKTAYSRHNLIRTRSQLKLLQSMKKQFPRMLEIIQKLL